MTMEPTGSEYRDLYIMYKKYGFPVNDFPILIDRKVMRDRAAHLLEELHELEDAIDHGNLIEIADALVDLVVLAKGTAIMCGLPWPLLWDEVHRANNSKVVGINPKRPGHTHDLIKPPGWVPPQIEKILWP